MRLTAIPTAAVHKRAHLLNDNLVGFLELRQTDCQIFLVILRVICFRLLSDHRRVVFNLRFRFWFNF